MLPRPPVAALYGRQAARAATGKFPPRAEICKNAAAPNCRSAVKACPAAFPPRVRAGSPPELYPPAQARKNRRGSPLSEIPLTSALRLKKDRRKFHFAAVLCSFNYQITPWQVLAITSNCCSRVRSINLTAYPETLIVKFWYSSFSGCSIQSMSFSVPNTFTFKWCAPWSK